MSDQMTETLRSTFNAMGIMNEVAMQRAIALALKYVSTGICTNLQHAANQVRGMMPNRFGEPKSTSKPIVETSKTNSSSVTPIVALEPAKVDVDLQIVGARTFMEQMASTGDESVSGHGSFLSTTAEVRAWLPKTLKNFNMRSMADIPCGDHNWLGTVKLPCDYVGYDLIPELIAQNKKKYPKRKFRVINAVTEVPAKAECILCRDLLGHLTIEHALQVLANFKVSGTKFLIVTTFPDEQNTELAQSHPGWGWRPVNMEAAPFNLKLALDGVQEVAAGGTWNRWLKMYRI